jgi:tetratricopeptide (TPR) repeat protein
MKRLGTAAIVLLLAIAVSYVPAFRAKYTNWDDSQYVGAARQPLRVLCTAVVTGHFHPLTMLSFGLDVRLFGMNPTEMHAVNVALHAGVAMLVLLLLYELTGSTLGALAGALFFAIHPLRVESVAWISERKDVLYGLFYVAGLLAYLAHVRRGASIAWSYLFFVLSLLAKGSAMTFPFALLIIDFVERGRPRIADKLAMFVLSIAAAAGSIAALHWHGTGLAAVHVSAPQRILIACRALVMYISREIVPLNLSAFYRYEAVGLAEWLSAAAIVVLAIAVMASFRRFPRVFAGFAFFAVTIAPMLPLLATGNAMAADRYTYIPSIGLSFVVALGVARMPARAAIAAMLVAGTLLGALTWRRCEVWHDAIALWTSVIEYDPAVAVAWNNLGHALSSGGNRPAAIAALSRAIELDPCYLLALRNRAQQVAELRDYERALRDVDQILRCDPQNAGARAMKSALSVSLGK